MKYLNCSKKKTLYSRLQLDDYISHLDSEVFYLLAKCMILYLTYTYIKLHYIYSVPGIELRTLHVTTFNSSSNPIRYCSYKTYFTDEQTDLEIMTVSKFT